MRILSGVHNVRRTKQLFKRLAKIAESYSEADMAVKRVSRTPSPEPLGEAPPNFERMPRWNEPLPPVAEYIEIDNDDEILLLSDNEDVIPPPAEFAEEEIFSDLDE